MTDPPRLDHRIATALHDLFGIPEAELRPDAELDADLQLDSLSVVELQVALEESTGMRINPEDPSAVRTLGDLQSVVEAAVAAGQPAFPSLKLSEDR
ncbi:MAG: phosphopantetheine-binding protein [Actinomycetota bacterium]|jgi:acyl carrier protein|nr:phosphopantetheine-binding protein [Actinomycetota bacterium]MDQ3530030.1 phosphopantetheine-binding protein [Actinomycetota bacterium]